jgi:hypothetical protein
MITVKNNFKVSYKVNNFGPYRVIGEIELIATCCLVKVEYELYFNHFNNKFFMVKQYSSGKYHIDFFMYSENELSLDYLYEIVNIEEVCRHDKNNIDSGLLFFNALDNKFLFVNNNGYSIELSKV